MKKVFEKIIEKLEDRIKSFQTLDITDVAVDVSIKETRRNIEIVNQVAEETSISKMETVGWIPVSERLPEENGFYVVTFGGELCGEDKAFVGMCEYENGKWWEDCVLAWKKDIPYQPTDNSETPKQTNFDNIKDMTVGEMAKMLDEYAFCHARTVCPYLNNNDVNCIQCITKWLQSEVEE